VCIACDKLADTAMSARPRISGVTVPVSAVRTRDDWGVGQIGDLPALAAWVRRAGQRLIQILPPYELDAGETSPYGARTAFGLDPIYLTIEDIVDLDPAAIETALGPEGALLRERLSSQPRVDFAAVRGLKAAVVGVAFDRFYQREWLRDTVRAQALKQFIDAQPWARDLGLYVALRARHGQWSWKHWPEGVRTRRREAMAQAESDLSRDILAHCYVEWVLHEQWASAKRRVNEAGVELMGDLPFIVGTESADVWAHQSEFRLDVSLGAPPDAFSEDGQDWGLPAYDWQTMDQNNLAWIRARTRHAASLYDRFRLDHVVGYFRMFVRPPSEQDAPKPRGWFDPEGEREQMARGYQVLRAIQEEAGACRVIGEDLGVIPPFVRESLTDMGISGYRVIPWENDDGRFRDPAAYPEGSVATWSTHDTAPITAWWDELSPHDRHEIARLARIDPSEGEQGRWLPLMRLLLSSRSELCLMLPQEMLGERTRINMPGTVGGDNWTYRLPMTLEDLSQNDGVNARMNALADAVRDAGR
jgi:4-alpha-glucanotransferase